jgi:nucleotide-binding universal stress UspA family protein
VVYQTIVVGTDGSASARIAVRHAAYLAAATRACLHLVTAVSATPIGIGPDMVHALPPSWIDANTDAARGTLDTIARELTDSGVDVVTHIAQGEPAESLLRYCDDVRADLLVVGDKGMHGPRRFLLGSVANRCAHHATCAVLVVPTSCGSP